MGLVSPVLLLGTRIRSLLDSRQLHGWSTFHSSYTFSHSPFWTICPADELKLLSNMTRYQVLLGWKINANISRIRYAYPYADPLFLVSGQLLRQPSSLCLLPTCYHVRWLALPAPSRCGHIYSEMPALETGKVVAVLARSRFYHSRKRDFRLRGRHLAFSCNCRRATIRGKSSRFPYTSSHCPEL